MKAHFTLSGAQWIVADLAMYGAGSNIAADAAVMKGATAGTNQGFAIVAASALAGILGVTKTLHTNASAGADSKQDGTAYTYLDKEVIINPDAVYLAEHTKPATSAIAIASVATTTVTITSLEDNIDGGWLWGSDNQLQYITSLGASDAAVTKSSSGWTTSITITKIHPDFWTLLALDSTAVKIQNAAAAGTGKVAIYRSYLKSNATPFQRLDPTKHSGVTYDSGLRIFQDILFRDHAFANNT